MPIYFDTAQRSNNYLDHTEPKPQKYRKRKTKKVKKKGKKVKALKPRYYF